MEIEIFSLYRWEKSRVVPATQELIFGFPELYPDKNVTVIVDENKIIFISETGQTHELGTSEIKERGSAPKASIEEA